MSNPKRVLVLKVKARGDQRSEKMFVNDSLYQIRHNVHLAVPIVEMDTYVVISINDGASQNSELLKVS